MHCHASNTLTSDLQLLKDGMTSQFLSLAGALNSISERGRELAGLSKEALSLVSTGEADAAGSFLQKVLSEAEQVQILGRTSRGSLSEVLSDLEQCLAPLSRLLNVPSTLNMVSMLTRVEGARVASAADGASAIARDVHKLAGSIEQHVESVARDAQILVEKIAHDLQHLNAGVRQRMQDSGDLINRTRTVLVALRAQSEASRAAAAQIDEKYANIYAATHKIVISLQTEDIARQQVEQIQQALLNGGGCVDDGSPEPEYAAVLAEHRAGLVRTRNLLHESLCSIAENLGALEPRIQELMVGTMDLASRSDQEGRSFAAAIEEGLTAVSLTFESYSGSARAMAAVVDAIVPALQRMALGAEEMSRIESAVRRTALNARIETAHLGGEGSTMKAISAEIQKIAEQSEMDTRLVLERLRVIEKAVAAIRDKRSSSQDSLLMSAGVDEARRQLGSAAEAIIGSARTVTTRLTQLRDAAGVLQSELRNGCGLVRQSEAICELCDKVLNRLEAEIVARGGTCAVIEQQSRADLSDVELF